MKYYKQTFLTSMDDFETSENHIAIWSELKGDYWEPDEVNLISVDGMGEDCCPDDLWAAALNSYGENYLIEDHDDEF